MKHLRWLIVLATISLSSLLFAQNHEIWLAFNSSNLPLAMELIEKHRETLDPLYFPNGDDRTIMWFLRQFDLIRAAPRPLTERENDDFVEIITGERPQDWLVLAGDEMSVEHRELIERFCGRLSVVGQVESKYLIHATEANILSLVENCLWVENAHGL